MSNIPKILIVDDDTRILGLLKQFFTQNGFDAEGAEDAMHAEEMLDKKQYDLLILDVMLPKITGFEFAKKLKLHSRKMPIIMLTALSDPEQRVEGLESGADDYMIKPFNPKELLIRAQNLLSLHSQMFENKREFINLSEFVKYDYQAKQLYKNNELVTLTSTEIKLIDYFIENKSKAISREELSEKMGGLGERSVDVQIARLREKIEENPKQPQIIQTVRHIGYVIYA